MGPRPWIFVNWWLFTFKKSKCPQLAKKAADIYERVQMAFKIGKPYMNGILTLSTRCYCYLQKKIILIVTHQGANPHF